MDIERKDKLGEGAYGVVYKGEMKKEDKILKVAIKRNFGEEENTGISSLREMSFLSLFNHPCITKLKEVSKEIHLKKIKMVRGYVSYLTAEEIKWSKTVIILF